MDNFAVFRYEGEEWDQISIWLSLLEAQEFLRNIVDRNPQKDFMILMRVI